MKKLLIKTYIVIHKVINPVLVFLFTIICCATRNCKIYKAIVNNKSMTLFKRKMSSPTTFAFVESIIAEYLAFTKKFTWKSDYFFGALDIHPSATLFLCRDERDDCDGPATAYFEIIKKSKTNTPSGIKISKLILYKNTNIFSPKFWRTLHVVLLVSYGGTNFILSNGVSYLAEVYFSSYYTNAGYVVYDSVKI